MCRSDKYEGTGGSNLAQGPSGDFEDGDIYDDACDFGKFCLNPFLFLFNLLCALIKKWRGRHRETLSLSTANDIQKNPDENISARAQQLFYVVAVFGSWFVIFAKVYPLCTESSHVPDYHKFVGYAVFVLCVRSWTHARSTEPGNITEDTIDKFDNYPYDGYLYVNKICPTLKIRKLARSKYDRRTGRHVPRFDHYCGWLNQTIGEENYRSFLWFLVVHVSMCWYGSVMIVRLFWGEALDAELLDSTPFSLSSSSTQSWPVGALLQVVLTHPLVSGTLILMCAMTLALGMFLGFHTYLISNGMTTNEHFKWKAVRTEHIQATRKYEHAINKGAIDLTSSFEPCSHAFVTGNDDDNAEVTCTGHKSSWIADVSHSGDNLVEEAEALDEESSSSCSSSSSSMVVNPGPMKRNIYDLGLVANVYEVVFPRSLRKLQERQKHK